MHRCAKAEHELETLRSQPAPPADDALRVAREALEKIRYKAGNHTVSIGESEQGENDPGFAGIYAVAVNALAALTAGAGE